ncbi:hypothetical protein NEFER03_1622 [Nematocida sp. LUAm3]|nr:hypothetical protein NEFER03_1622 [Nematocida sp. LUAm3]KAI5176118.1 hypothetical protein NEFER02_1939 [Nematocida sp. LUAm2]KAI5179006.1 hypothetical protein NEFER01_1882 [Nematocida sp. LUAm1]
MKNKNFKGLLEVMRRKRKCWKHGAGACPGFLLRDTKYVRAPCYASHAPGPQTYEAPKRLLSELREEIEEIMRSVVHKAPSCLEHEKYYQLKENIFVLRIFKNESLLSRYKEELKDLREKYEDASVEYLPCAICPEKVPWRGNKRKLHESHPVHVAYRKMKEYLRKGNPSGN